MSNIPPKQQRVPTTKTDIVTFNIKIRRADYDLFSKFAQFLYNQPAQDPNTGQFLLDKNGKKMPSLPAPDIQTYFLTCAYNTYQSYQMVMQMVKKQQAQAQAQQQKP